MLQHILADLAMTAKRRRRHSSTGFSATPLRRGRAVGCPVRSTNVTSVRSAIAKASSRRSIVRAGGTAPRAKPAAP